MALWTPYDYEVLPVLDLDASVAASTATIATNGQWLDQSPEELHAVQATSTAKPSVLVANLNDLDVLNFDGGDYMITPNIFNAASDVTIFIVHKATSIGATGDAAFGLQNGLNATNGFFHALARSDIATKYRSFFAADGDAAGALSISPPANFVINEWRVSCHYRSATVRGFGFDGTVTEQAAVGQCNFSNAKGIVGCYRQATYAWNGPIARILVIPAILPTNAIEKYFGCLHHRYGLASLLPVDHVYKTAPPEVLDAVGGVVAPPMLISGTAVNPVVAVGNIVHSAPSISGKVWNVGLGDVTAPKMLLSGEATNPIVSKGAISMSPKVSGSAYNPVSSSGGVVMGCPKISGMAVNNKIATGGLSILGKVWGTASNPKELEIIRFKRLAQ